MPKKLGGHSTAVWCAWWSRGEGGGLVFLTLHVLSFPQLWMWFVASLLFILPRSRLVKLQRLQYLYHPPHVDSSRQVWFSAALTSHLCASWAEGCRAERQYSALTRANQRWMGTSDRVQRPHVNNEAWPFSYRRPSSPPLWLLAEASPGRLTVGEKREELTWRQEPRQNLKHITPQKMWRRNLAKKKAFFCEPGRGVKQGDGKGSMYKV